MNTAAKCECCVCEPVCKYKDTYLAGIEAIMGAQIPLGEAENGFTFWEVKNCPHIEVSIKCPHMVAKTRVRDALRNDAAFVGGISGFVALCPLPENVACRHNSGSHSERRQNLH